MHVMDYTLHEYMYVHYTRFKLLMVRKIEGNLYHGAIYDRQEYYLNDNCYRCSELVSYYLRFDRCTEDAAAAEINQKAIT